MEKTIDINYMTASEALYGFCGWLTTRDEKTIMSSSNDASIIADLIAIFCKANKLAPPRKNFNEKLISIDKEDGYNQVFDVSNVADPRTKGELIEPFIEELKNTEMMTKNTNSK